ncbi:helicase/secretion neighborhood TadE-like protein [Amycolatopsis marina]|uniref:Helicase/secretion neighborhood TadE-like protein n=1 Tax=Amycolatopsis marina TaxID=490629 RepID=A0A1I0Y853_9PSEU|nr:helicase/secretion neighborhood TadE-like protein [Amycolatopsis marina]
MTALLVITGVVLWLGGAIVARQRAAAAADLAALAAAGAAVFGVDHACAEASRVAERMRVRITNCGFDGWDALVEVETTLPGALGASGAVRARARAGPVGPLGEIDERSKGDRPTGRA